MKKQSFVSGAFVSTIGLILTKIIGMLYVIPFRAIIGVEGAVLYSYAYTIYAVFVGLSSSGIPGAMAKTVSEYNALEYYHTQEKAYKIGKYIIVGIGIVSFLILFIFAPKIAYLIIGDIEGGNTIEDIAYVIRIISTALLIIPFLSVSKGYVQGHKMMVVPAISNVIEQLVRVIVILGGSFLALKVFKLSIATAVGVATFGATVGALVAYIYILDKIKKNKEALMHEQPRTREEGKYTNKVIINRLVKYSLPFILIEFLRSLYNTVDTFTIVKGLVSLGYNVSDSEKILSIVTTWGSKLNMIILSIAFGLAMSIIPNIASSAILKKYDDVEKKINQSLLMILFTTLPMTIGIWFLAKPVWTVFYGYDSLSITIFSFLIWQTIPNSFYCVLVDATNALSKPKIALGTLIVSFLGKAILNLPMMSLFQFLNIKAYYAPITTTILVQVISVIFLLIMLKKSYNISYKLSIKPAIKIILISCIMFVSLLILKMLIGDFDITRWASLLEILIYGLFGIIIYFFLCYKHNLFKEVLGKEIIDKFLKNILFRKTSKKCGVK